MTGQNWFDAVLAFITGSGITGALTWLRAHSNTIMQVTGKIESLLGDHQALYAKVAQIESQVLGTPSDTQSK